MLKLKNKLAKRILAFVLSGAMVVSGISTSGITAFAAENATEISTETVEESLEETEESEATVVSDDAEEETPNEDSGADAKGEETQVSEETVQVTDTETIEDKQTSETKSSKDAEKENTVAEDEEETEKDEDVKAEAVLDVIGSTETAVLDIGDLHLHKVTDAGIEENAATLESGTKLESAVYFEETTLQNGDKKHYFSVTGNNQDSFSEGKRTFYYYDYGTKKLTQSEKGTYTANALRIQPRDTMPITFKTEDKMDVTIFWGSKYPAQAGNQVKIKKSGEAEQVLFEHARVNQAQNEAVVSEITLEAGEYTFTFAQNYLYRIVVQKHRDGLSSSKWDFKTNDRLNALDLNGQISKYAIDLLGLSIVVPLNKTDVKDTSIKTGDKLGLLEGFIFVPVPEGKTSRLTITTTSVENTNYSVNGKSASTENVTSTFLCKGEADAEKGLFAGYAKIQVTGATEIECIEVQEIATHTVSGTVTGIADADKADAKIVFTDKADDTFVFDSAINSANGSYSVELYEGSTYTISIGGKPEYKDKYKITTPATGEVEVENADKSESVTVEEDSSLVNITEDIVGFETLPENFKLIFTGNDNSTPSVTVDSTNKTYSVSLRPEVEYTITAEGDGVKNYDFSPEMIKSDSAEKTITFTEKEKKAVNLRYTSFDGKLNLDGKTITFTDKNAEDYIFNATIGDTIALREGTYSVKIEDNAVRYPYMLETITYPDVMVGTNAVDYSLNYVERMEWDFTAGDPELKTGDQKNNSNYNGLVIGTIKFDVQYNNTNKRVQVNKNATFKIPVSGSGSVAITVTSADNSTYKVEGVAADTSKAENIFEYNDLPKGSYLMVTDVGVNPDKSSMYLTKIKVTRTKEAEGGIDPADKHNIWIVGDSTSCTYNTVKPDGEIVYGDDCYYPRYGYGEVLQDYIDEYYTVNNLALSGASSKDFMSKGGGTNYNRLKSEMAEGDVLIIAFGHNDTEQDTRYTNPNGDWQTEGSFAKSLYDNYIKIAQEKHAIPILCTPIVRRSSKDQYTGDRIHISAGTEDYPGGDYRQAIVDLGIAKDVPVIDLTMLTKAKWEELTASESVYLHRWNAKSEDPTSVDNTHLNVYGAKVVAHMLAKQISELDKTKVPLAEHTANLDKVPTKENALVANPNYAGGNNNSNYVPPTGKSTIWGDYGIFSGSVFGSVSNEINATNYTLGKDNNGMRIKSSNGTQVSGTEDGRAMYYYKLPSDSTFTLTAKATVNAMGDDATTAFGLMARDDMLIDTKFDAAVHTDGEGKTTDYVVAGTFAKDSANCFRRQSGTLTKGEGNGETIAPVEVGKTYNLSLSFNGTGYVCKVADNDQMSQGYDYMLGTIDKSQYIGMFVSGNADITFSDIKLIVDGKEVEIGDDNPDDPNKPGDDPNKPGDDDPNKPGDDDPNKPGDNNPNNPTKPSDKIPADTKLKRISISDESKIKIEAANVVYSKKQPYSITVTYTYDSDKKDTNGNPITYQQQLTEGLHYKVKRAEDESSVGEKTVTIEGTNKGTDLGTFINSKTITYKVVGKKDLKDISKVRLTLDKNELKEIASYKNDYITPTVQGLADLGDAANYKVVYKNNINVGKASVTIIGQNEYFGAKVLPFTIKKADIAKTEGIKITAANATFTKGAKSWEAKTTAGVDFVYQGSPIEFNGFKVELENGKALRPQEDYTLVYKKNAQTGKAVLTVKGANNYSGTIKIDYTIAENAAVGTELSSYGTSEKPLDAEYSSKGARLTEIKLLNSGITLKENKDYKVTYSKESKAKDIALGDIVSVKIAGINSYKNVIAKDTEVQIKVVAGSYHIKEGTIVDAKKATADDKVVNAAKITDASGAKVKPADVNIEWDNPTTTIKVTPSDSNADKDKYKETTLSCRIAEKLASLKIDKLNKIADQPFDGVNSVTLTEKRIAAYLTGTDSADAKKITAEEIEIVSYKNNNKLGSAVVTIKGTDTGRYYGTRNLSFKITANTESDRDPDEEESSSSGGSTGSPSEPSTGDDPTDPTDPTDPSDPTDPTETEPETNTDPDPDKPTPPSDKKLIDVWDFGGVEESNTEIYRNHITIAAWDAYDGLGKDGKFTTDTTTFDDLLITHIANSDRIYSASTIKNAGSMSKYATASYDDGYTAKGCYYGGGTGGTNRRHLTIQNVLAGDKIDVYVGTSDSKATDFYFEYLGNGGTQKDTGSIGTENQKLSFIAKYSGTYKIWADGSGGKPITNRVKRVPAVDVSGTIDLGPLESLDGAALKFVNETTKAETDAVLNGTNFTVKLAAGYTYNAVLTGKIGYGPTNESKKLVLRDTDVLEGKSGVTVVLETKELYDCSGTIKGFAADYARKADLKVVMKTAPDVLSDDVELTITGLNTDTPSFTAKLEPDVEYTITLEGVNDYQVKGSAVINNNKALTKDIEVEPKPVYEAKGNFVDLEDNAVTAVTELKFKNDDDGYEYTATVMEGKAYTANLRDGAYSAEATVEGWKTTGHVVVEGKAVNKDILFVSTAEESDLTRKADLYVGYSDKGDANYETVNRAVKAAKRMKPTKEQERITIHIAPGVYREQIIVDVPYISFVNDTPDKEVTLTWYQGIGYLYYSCATNGFYNAQDAHDQYKKAQPKNWGATVQIKATGFLAENIVFEHSLNRYLTDEELADGVEPDPNAEYIKPVRDYNLDVKSKDATERGAALYFETGGDKAEFYRCKFLSSQDTVGTCKKGENAYFKECFIEGNTDYICGDGDVVFDNCVLNFYGYSDKEQGGYITAAKDTAANGYLFWNCTVTGNSDKKMQVGAGDFGRPWGQGAKVTFVNTKLERADLILDRGWNSMSGATPENANFAEYNTTSLDGKTVDTSKRVAGTVKTTNPVPNAEALKKYFGGWTPKHYVAEASTVAFATKPFISDNGDMSLLKPGHTLTVNYSLGEANDANDASIIKWYRVKDSAETLIKTSTAQQSRSYKVQTEDVDFYIKVEVTPTTASGAAGTKEVFQITDLVQEGWDEPGNPADAVLGNGVNVFLAGDSTVKDYSAKGMYNGGNARVEGSWGEYIQSFFNEEKVTIVNYANGGRSTRNFLNEGSLDKIKKDIKEGDYLFIQFGHNDCSADYPDRFVPVGEPNAEGIYPTTEATTKNAEGKYDYNCGGTFKWFLKQYIDVAKEAEAIPVLVTPVARMYYTSDGKIRSHHDCEADEKTPDNTYTSSGDAYVVACRQLAEEEGVLIIDAFEATKKMYEDAWTECNGTTNGERIMGDGEKTHCNKLGGFIEAGILVQEIKKLTGSDDKALNITAALKKPAQVLGKTPDPNSKTVFSINASSKLTAYDIKADPSYSTETEYWTGIGQDLIDGAVAN